MVTGSLATHFFNWKDASLFIIELGVFLGSIYGLFKFYSGKRFDKGYKGAKQALLIVGAATLILIAGSLASHYYSFKDAIGFVIELGTFLAALGVLFWGIGKLFKSGIKRARKLVNIVIASSLIMVMAQLLYDYLDTEKIFGFVAILGGFIIALGAVFWIAGKLMKKAFIGIALMILVTAAAGTILLLAGKIVSDNPGILTAALLFGGTIALYVAVMGLVCGLLGTFIGNILLGALAMVGIMAVTLLAIGVMLVMYAVSSQPKFYDTIIEGLKAMGWVFGSFIAVIVALGIAVMGPQAALLAAGATALGIIEGLVWAAAKVLSAIAISVKQLQSVNVSKEGFKQMEEIIKGFAGLTLLLIDKFPSKLKLAKLLFIIPAVKKMSEAVGSMAKGIKEFADLRIPTVFNPSTGEPIAWVTIANKDFATAQENIGKTLTCIVDAILSVAKTHPDLFKPGLISDSKAMNAAKVAKKMGESVASIATGIKEMSDLKIVSKYDSKGNAVEWISLGQKEFETAKTNIANILECINDALLKVAKEKPELFDDHLFTASPAMNAAKVGKKMGEAVGSIAKGIKEFADLKIAIKYNSNGVAIEYQSLIGKDFDKAKDNIKNVIICISDALLKVAKEKPELFDDKLFKDSPAMNAAKVAKKMGEAIGSIAIGIKDWADLKIATKFDSTGKAIEYKSLVDDDFDKAKEKITAVLTCIGQALVTTVKGNTELFDDGVASDSPAMQAAKAMAYMGTTLAITATAVAAYSKGQIPTYDKDGNLLPEGQWIKMDLEDMSKGKDGKTYKAIYTVLTCLGSALVSIVKNPENKELLDTGWFGGDSPAMQAAKSVQLVGDTLSNMIKVITDLSNMKTEDLSSKIDTIKTNISASLTSIVSIFDLFASNKSETKKEQEAVKGGFKGFINNVAKVFGNKEGVFKTDGSLAEYINNHIKDVEKAGDAINDFKTVLSSLINSLASLGETYKQNEELLKLYNVKDEKGNVINSPLITIFTNAFTTINSLYTTIVSSLEKSSIDIELLSRKNEELIKIINLYNAELNVYTNLMNKVISSNITNNSKQVINIFRSEIRIIKSVYNLLTKSFKNTNIDLLANQYNKITSLINYYYDILIQFERLINKINEQNILEQGPSIMLTFDGAMNIIKYLYNSIVSSENISIEELSQKTKELNELINFYIGTLDNFILLGDKSKSYGSEGYNVLRDGILQVYLATSSIFNVTNFKNHTDDLERYVEAINNIDLSRINSLKNLVDSLNTLSVRLGNLDKLTEVMSNKLSAVLLELVNQLRMADHSIKNAHELQERRKKLIEESIDKVKTLMANPMIVEISQKSEEDISQETPTGTIDNNPVNTSTPTGTDDSKQNYSPELESPDNINNKQKSNQQYNNNSDILTKSEFENLMKRNMKGWGEN